MMTSGGTRILVTGGSGFIGTNLVEFYLRRGAEVLNLDHAFPRNPAHQTCWYCCDLRDAEAVKALVREFDPTWILQMGARTDLEGSTPSDYAANTDGTAALIDAASQCRSIQRIIFASSRLVCRIGYQPKSDSDYCPTTAYGQSKVQGERLVRQLGSRLPGPWVIVRPTSIWGPWFDVPYKTFFLTIARRLYVHPGGPDIPKSFGYVENTVFQLDRLLTCEPAQIHGKTMYLADYPPLHVRDFAEAIREAMGLGKIRTVPRSVLRAAAATGDLAKRVGWKNPPLSSFRLENLLTPMVHEMSSLQLIAPRLPYSMREGVSRTVGWLREQGQI